MTNYEGKNNVVTQRSFVLMDNMLDMVTKNVLNVLNVWMTGQYRHTQ